MNVTTVIMVLDTLLNEQIQGLNNKEFDEFRCQISYIKSWLRTEMVLELDEEEKDLIHNDKLIHAIKHLRERAGRGLKEAADVTRAYRAQWTQAQINHFGKDLYIALYARQRGMVGPTAFHDAEVSINSYLEYVPKK